MQEESESSMLEALLRSALDEVKDLPGKDAEVLRLYIQAAVDLMSGGNISAILSERSIH